MSATISSCAYKLQCNIQVDIDVAATGAGGSGLNRTNLGYFKRNHAIQVETYHGCANEWLCVYVVSRIHGTNISQKCPRVGQSL